MREVTAESLECWFFGQWTWFYHQSAFGFSQ